MHEGCNRVSSCGDFRQLVALQPNPEPAGEHQSNVYVGEDTFSSPKNSAMSDCAYDGTPLVSHSCEASSTATAFPTVADLLTTRVAD